MKIGLIMRRYDVMRTSPIMPEVACLLRDRGTAVDIIHPEEAVIDLSRVRVEHDLYIIKAKTGLALSLAGALHSLGAVLINPYPVTAIMRDKIITTRILQMAGVPVPATYITADLCALAPLLASGPLVVKPYRGSGGVGVHVVANVDQLAAVPPIEGPIFAQRYHAPQGRDHKIYCIGGQLFGVQRVWPPRTYEEKLGEPFPLSPELHDLAVRCGHAFGLDLYGLDVIISDGRSYVVDISSFPGFKGVPDAAQRLAEYIYAAAQRALKGEVLLPSAKK